jgi:hypothetical protein
MPIRPFLNGERFDSETIRVLGVALEMTSIALRTGDSDDDVKQAIATKIIALAKGGERNPDILCEKALKDIRGSQVSRGGPPVSETNVLPWRPVVLPSPSIPLLTQGAPLARRSAQLASFRYISALRHAPLQLDLLPTLACRLLDLLTPPS